MRRPPPESLRAAKNLTAPSSYSYVSGRQPETDKLPQKRAERPTLPGGGSPSALLDAFGTGKAPSSMAEAIARVGPKKQTAHKDAAESEPEAAVQVPSTEKRVAPGGPEADAPTLPIARSAAADLPVRQPIAEPKPEVPASVFGLRKSTPPGPPPPSAGGFGIKLSDSSRAEMKSSDARTVTPVGEDSVGAAISDADIDGMLDGLDDSVDALLDDIDAGFDRIVQGRGAVGDAGLTDGETREVQELFTQIAAGHMRPVRDFMMELELGDPPREWLDLVRPAVASLGNSAEGMGLGELRAGAGVFLDALDAVAGNRAPRISAQERKDLTEAFEIFSAELPGAFDLEEERDRREPIILQSLLRQIPNVRKVALEKLYAAGLTSLEMYYAAKPYDVAQAAGLDEDLAERIVRRFARYRRETSVGAPDLERSHEHKKLALLVTRLAQQNEAFEAASKAWSKKAQREKKRIRKERTDTVLEVNVLLARLGAVELVNGLEKLPFQAKVEALRAYMNEVKEQAAGDGG